MKKWKDKKKIYYSFKVRKLERINYRNRKKHKRQSRKKFFLNYNEKSFYSFIKSSEFSKNKKSKYSIKSKSTLLKIPKSFSLFHNPDQVIKTLNIIHRISKDGSISDLKFDHSECEELELGASVIMDIFVINALGYRKLKNNELGLSGIYSKNHHVNTILNVSGLVKTLNLDDEIDDIVNNTHGIEKLDLIMGGKNTQTLKVNTTMDSGTASTHLAEYFNSCLHTQGYQLEPEGMSQITEMVGEVLDNSAIHSGEFSQWFMLANYFIVNNESEYGECNIVMFNFGQTIYEGMHKMFGNPDSKYDETSIKMRDNLYKLSETHKSKGFFKKTWTEETLWTLYALQDGVSRCLSKEDPTRGTGTVKMIEAFQKIGSTADGKEPEMCLISGRSHILFTSQYALSENEGHKHSRQIIAFNKENNLYSPPDKDYVKTMSNYFPGTIITMKFYLDRKYMEKIRGE
ncbi:hypothetical protein A0U40_17625 [[Bacillus] sp. KCTC 13219]|nr:hypothetical protein A0U40_17625 [[Bacillus] sp. KCTC 13219]